LAVQKVPPVVPTRPLFSDSLLETTVGERKRRGFAAVLSITLEAVFVGSVLILPLVFTDALPKQQLLTFLVAPPPPPPPPAPAAPAVNKVVRQIQSNLLKGGQLRAPTRIPARVQIIHEEEAPPEIAGVEGGVAGGIPGGQLGGVIGGIVSHTSNLATPKLLAPSVPKRIRISQGVTKGQLVYRKEPAYPPLARMARVQGEVLLKAIVGKDGSIRELEVVSGSSMLTAGAMAAVQQWRYRPFLLNGEPVEVETNVTVIFQIPQ
jgi:protein TonB